MHLALAAKRMQAVKMSGIDTHVINSSFPDVVNVSLSKLGMAPTVGIGNASLVVPIFARLLLNSLICRCGISAQNLLFIIITAIIGQDPVQAQMLRFTFAYLRPV